MNQLRINTAKRKEKRLSFQRISNHFRKCIRSVRVVSKHLLWNAVVHPEIAGYWMLLMQYEDDWLTYRDPLIPVAEPEQVIPDIDAQKVLISHCLSKDAWSLFPRELIFLCAMVGYLKPKTIFEFGTSLGRTTYNLALNAPEDAVVYTLDLPQLAPATSHIVTEYALHPKDANMIFKDRSEVIFDNKPEAHKIRPIFSDSAKLKVNMLRRSVNFVFIDASHSFEYVQNDSEKAFEMLAPGGTIVWHDFTNGCHWPDVRKYLRKLAVSKNLARVSKTNLVIYRDAS